MKPSDLKGMDLLKSLLSEAVPDATGRDDRVSTEDAFDDLCDTAYELLLAAFPSLPNVAKTAYNSNPNKNADKQAFISDLLLEMVNKLNSVHRDALMLFHLFSDPAFQEKVREVPELKHWNGKASAMSLFEWIEDYQNTIVSFAKRFGIPIDAK